MNKANDMKCPKCKNQMEFDSRKTGFIAIKHFWYCDNPKCDFYRIERVYKIEDSKEEA